jgi:hypothetical protein
MSPARREVKKDGGEFIDFKDAPPDPGVDPAVSALLGQAERRQSEARLSRREREKKKKERDKIRARRPFHTTYDIPVELRQKIKDIAERHSVPASQVATLGLLMLVKALDNGQVDLGVYKSPSRSPRYDWNLVLPVEDVLGGGGKRKR